MLDEHPLDAKAAAKLAVCQACPDGAEPFLGNDCRYYWPSDATCAKTARKKSGWRKALMGDEDQCEWWK